MPRPVTLFTVQWADLPLETVAALAAGWGDDGLALACAGDHLGASVVAGCSRSPLWHLLYSQPPVLPHMIEQGYARFAELWNPILDVFDACGVRFALEVMPTQIAYDVVTARRALEALDHRPAFGFNFDPSHLFW